MRFPFALTKKIASHIIKHKLRKTPKFAMVLQLEPLHTCNLTCTGCGRIREYSTSLKDMVPLEQCLRPPWNAMRRWFHLRRRTADLSEDRGT
jgi:MoaA/NifB/PqqE/SkfB family radical SAM enzyme